MFVDIPSRISENFCGSCKIEPLRVRGRPGPSVAVSCLQVIDDKNPWDDVVTSWFEKSIRFLQLKKGNLESEGCRIPVIQISTSCSA